MFKSHDSNLVRLHPKRGGVGIDFGNQYFQGVSTDLFFGLDLNDFSKPYHITRKFNISIAINPTYWPVTKFLSYVTQGDLQATEKCSLHGDKDTGLRASSKLLCLLNPCEFEIDGVQYVYDSVGVACNQSYDSVSHRKGNPFEKSSSHFEIKFRRQSEKDDCEEYLCLNIHLMKETDKSFGSNEAIERLKQAINLFHAELGLSTRASTPRTNLKSALFVTLDDYESHGFSCKHEKSLEALQSNAIAVKYTHNESKNSKPLLWDFIVKAQEKQSIPSLNETPRQTAGFFNTIINDSSLPKVEVPPAPSAWSKKLTF